MDPKTLGEALKNVQISPKETFDTLTYAIVLNKLERVIKGDKEDTLIGQNIHTPEALMEYTEDITASADCQKLTSALRLMAKEILALRVKNTQLEERWRYANEKHDLWEERARTLYRELHGKDAPPQGG